MPKSLAQHIGVLLAAGAGTRFGGAYPGAKLDQPFGDTTVGIRSFENLLAACDAVVVVVRDHDASLARHARARGAAVIVNATPARGLGRSLALAADYVITQHPNALFIWASLADMPWIEKNTFDRIRLASQGGKDSSQSRIVQPIFIAAAGAAHERHRKPGHPVVMGRAHWPMLAALDGDAGARSVIATHPDCVALVETDDVGVWRDVDTPADLLA